MTKKKIKKPSIQQQLMDTVKVPMEWIEAPMWKRFVAFIFDMFLIGPVVNLISPINPYLPMLVVVIYYIGLEASPWKGSVGKRIMSMKVIDVKQGKVTMGRLLIRYVVKFLSILLFGIGYWLPVNFKMRPIPDLASQTMVIALTPSKAKTK
jgi:uncharacterized RDD family membrane protein YckC